MARNTSSLSLELSSQPCLEASIRTSNFICRMIPTTLWWRMVLTCSNYRWRDVQVQWNLRVVRCQCCSFQWHCFSTFSSFYYPISILSASFITSSSPYIIMLFCSLSDTIGHFKTFTIDNTALVPSTVYKRQWSVNIFPPIPESRKYYVTFSISLKWHCFL